MTLLFRLTLLLVFLLTATSKTIAQNCKELIHYRDIELVEQFDAANAKYKRMYIQMNEAIADAKNHKERLLSEKGWDEFMSIGTAMSDKGAQAAQIAAVVKSYCDLLSGVMEMMPGTHTAITAAKKIRLTVEQTYNIIKTGKDLKEIVGGNLETVGYKYALDEMNIAGKAIKTAMEFRENLNKLIEIPEQKEELKSTVERILNIADAAILKYKQKLEKTKAELNEQIAIEQGITKYLSENCKNFPYKKKPQNLTKEKISNPEKKTTIKDKNVSGNAFYIFLTTTLQSSKTFYAISKPVLHEGSLTDDMQIEKQQFIADIQKQFANKPDLLAELYNKEIEVHYGKPYSRQVLKSKEDGIQAIEAYKNSVIELLEGLKKFEFIELK